MATDLRHASSACIGGTAGKPAVPGCQVCLPSCVAKTAAQDGAVAPAPVSASLGRAITAPSRSPHHDDAYVVEGEEPMPDGVIRIDRDAVDTGVRIAMRDGPPNRVRPVAEI